jgi:hypothetical protein
MDVEFVICSLVLETFSLDFKAKLNASIESTTIFQPPGVVDYVFAAGEIWLRTPDATSLLVEEASSANLIETLRTLELRASATQRNLELERRIPVGGWGRWMSGYWARLNEDRSADDDEKIYSVLITALIVDGEQGCVVAYRYGNEAFIEVCTRPGANGTPEMLHSKFEPDVLHKCVRRISSELRDATRARM